MNKKKWIILGIGVVALVGIIVAIFFLFFTEKGFRLLKVFEHSGESSVTRGTVGEIEPYD